ncbi:MAG: hypothetical protein AAGA78_17070 [Pseudomonadota bacterium]
MRHLVLAITLSLASPSLAQDTSEPEAPPRWSLEDLLGGLLQEQFKPFMRDFVGSLEALADQVGDLSAYELPEVLPNGDIILRRKKDAPPLPAPPDPEGTVDL